MRLPNLFSPRSGAQQRIKRFWLVLAAAFASTTLFAQSSYVNFEGKQTSPVRLSPDGTRLFAVNTPDARLSVFDVSHPSNPVLIAEIPVGIEPVSVNPRTADEVWVVNEVSDSISIVSVSQRLVTDTLYVKDEPADVVFAGGRAFVTAARKNQVVVFDATNHVQLAPIPLLGENPRALAVNSAGTKVYAAFALSGNHTTLIPASNTNAPPQSPPTNTNLPAPPKVGLIVDARDPNWTNIIKYTMPDNDVAEIDVTNLTVTRYYTNIGTVNLALAVRPDTGDLYVANTEARNLVHFEPGVRGHIVDNRVTRITIGTGAQTFYDLNPGVNYAVLPNLPALTNALAQPTAIVFAPSGSFFYVAAFGTDRIARMDNNGNILSWIEVGNAIGSVADPRNKRGPRGLALNATTQRLYVLNRIANTLSIIDTSTDTLLKELPIGGFDPTPAAIRAGRGFLYDAKLSGNGTAACAACHIDAEMDMLAWDLGDPNGNMVTVTNSASPVNPLFPSNNFQMHPMKGPMTTQTLRGLAGQEPFHWRGDRTNFAHFNGAFGSLLGGTPLSSADMAAYMAFATNITFQANPNQNMDRTYPTNFAGGDAVAGRNTFFNESYQPFLTCNTCHAADPGPGSNQQLIPAILLQESQSFKVPHLRAAYQKLSFNNKAGANSIGGFGFTHDGADPTLTNFLSKPVFGIFATNTVKKANLNAFVQCFDTGTAPTVGYTRTLLATNVNTLGLSNDWALLEAQATVSNIDLIVKGTIDGKPHGLLYQPATADYRVDSTTLVALTHAQLKAKILAGDRLSLMGVTPGSGLRMAIDRDLDGVLDGDVTPPSLQITHAGGNPVLSWPYAAAGYTLESSPSLSSASWTAVTAPVEISGGRNLTTNPPPASTRFYRLHLP
jgi:DNA-binding beta-propeller fold protein YncE